MLLKKFINRSFPYHQYPNIRWFYVLTFLTNLFFIEANWYFYWTRFMTVGQLGIMDASTFAFGLLMEIPSGAASDLLGKKKTLVMAMAVTAVSAFGMAGAQNMMQLWIAFFAMQFGWAFYSGSAEALAYDSLAEVKEEAGFEEVISSTGMLTIIAAMLATLSGGALYALHYRLSHLAWAIAYFLAFLVTLKLTEPKVDTEKFSLHSYMNQLKEGTKQLLRPIFRPFILIILTLLGFDYVFHWGMLKPAMAVHFGFTANQQAVLFAILGLLGALSAKMIPWFRRKVSDKRGLVILSVLMGFGFMLGWYALPSIGLVSLLFIWIAGTLSHPWISVVVNREIPSAYRATTLSTVALITRIPYVLLAVVAASLAEQGKTGWFSLTLAVMLFMSVLFLVLLSLFKKRYQS